MEKDKGRKHYIALGIACHFALNIACYFLHGKVCKANCSSFMLLHLNGLLAASAEARKEQARICY